MNKNTFTAGERTVTLHRMSCADAPLVVLNGFEGDGSDVVEALGQLGCADVNLLRVGGLDWNHDMSPWPADAVFKGGEAFGGGADAHLELLLDKILPQALDALGSTPQRTCIAGYSLAGLFALYAMYSCDAFESVASMSGSLWFPGFIDFARTHEMMREPRRVYLSVGDKEARTKNPQLKTVQERTEQLAAHYRELGYDVDFELNCGNHVRDAALRCAKGIAAISARSTRVQ